MIFTFLKFSRNSVFVLTHFCLPLLFALFVSAPVVILRFNFSDSDYRPYFVDHDAVEVRRGDEKAMEQFKKHAERVNAILREFVGNPKDPKNPPVMLEWGVDLYLAIGVDFGYLDEDVDVQKEKVRIQSKLLNT